MYGSRRSLVSQSTDTNECFLAALTSIDVCENDENAECVNTAGFYNCSCVPGYERINGSCHSEYYS